MLTKSVRLALQRIDRKRRAERKRLAKEQKLAKKV